MVQRIFFYNNFACICDEAEACDYLYLCVIPKYLWFDLSDLIILDLFFNSSSEGCFDNH